MVDGIAKTGKPVTGFGIEGHGDLMTVARAARVAKDYVQWASELKREDCDISELWVSTKCGESDTTTGLASCPTVGNMYDKLIPQGLYGVFGETSEITGAEHLAKARAATPEIGEKWFRVWQAYEDEVIQAHKTNDLSESQPTKGNIAGGLTTIEEKALGNLEKIGRTCTYIDVLEPAEAPARGPGLYYMDTSSAAAECITLMGAAGYVVHTFPTGQGNVIVPVPRKTYVRRIVGPADSPVTTDWCACRLRSPQRIPNEVRLVLEGCPPREATTVGWRGVRAPPSLAEIGNCALAASRAAVGRASLSGGAPRSQRNTLRMGPRKPRARMPRPTAMRPSGIFTRSQAKEARTVFGLPGS
jgi:D-galactarate dehydratase/altronate hydrolase